MSRQELAEAINTHLWNTRQRVTTLDGRYVGKLERGEHRWPQADYRQALRTILHAPTDATLGFYATRSEERLSGTVVQGRQSMMTGDAIGRYREVRIGDEFVDRWAGHGTRPALRHPLVYVPFQPAALDRPALDWLCDDQPRRSNVSGRGRRVDPGEIDAIARQLGELRDLDHRLGAGAVAGQVSAFLDECVCPLMEQGSLDSEPAAAVHQVAIGAHELAGYQAVDMGADGVAQRHYLRALALSRAAGQRAFGAYLLGVSLGHLALHCGQPERGLRMAQIAIMGLPADATPAVRAALFAVLARAHARLGDEPACTDALRMAQAQLGRSDPLAEPVWIGYLTDAYLADEVAHCLFDLGCHDSAQREVRHAVEGVGSGRVRRLAIDTALLASALAGVGRVEEACARGRDAADLAARTGSARAVQRVAQLRIDLMPFDGTRPVAELVDYLHTTLPAAR